MAKRKKAKAKGKRVTKATKMIEMGILKEPKKKGPSLFAFTRGYVTKHPDVNVAGLKEAAIEAGFGKLVTVQKYMSAQLWDTKKQLGMIDETKKKTPKKTPKKEKAPKAKKKAAPKTKKKSTKKEKAPATAKKMTGTVVFERVPAVKKSKAKK